MEKRYERLGRRYTALFFWIGLLGLAAVFVLFFLLRVSPSGRMSVVIASDPVVVWSWDSSSQNSVIVTIPADTALDALHGYGRYALSSLWKLGEIDRHEQALLGQTTSDALAVPIPWYIGFSRTDLTQISDPYDVLARTFGVSSLWLYLRGAFRTNLPLGMYIRFMRALAWVSEGKTKQVNLSLSNALVQTQEPDGSAIKGIDVERLDVLLGDDFEDARVRAEALHVAVFNATSTPTLGGRFARLLSHMGISVVAVGNSDQKVSGFCELFGSTSALASVTARSLRTQFGCIGTSRAIEGGERADLTVLVGDGYASLFAPRAGTP